MFERFTNQSRRVVVLAQEEARALDHNYIGTEHLLLGLLHEGRGSAARALGGQQAEQQVLGADVVMTVAKGGLRRAPQGLLGRFVEVQVEQARPQHVARLCVRGLPGGAGADRRVDLLGGEPRRRYGLGGDSLRLGE